MPERQSLPRGFWGVRGSIAADQGTKPNVIKRLEDTPFYVRSVLESSLLGAVTRINDAQKRWAFEVISARFGKNLRRCRFGVWGLAFKPDTNDLREAPSRVIVRELARRGATLRAYDPAASEDAARVLPDRPLVRQALADLAWLAEHLQRACPDLQIGFDLSDMSGYAYYSGTRFALYGGDWSDALVRGGRYDEVGAVFGRNRPAAGFSLDLKALLPLVPMDSKRMDFRVGFKLPTRL